MPQPRSCPTSAFSLLNEGGSCVWPCFWTQVLLTDLGTSCHTHHTLPLTESCLTQGQRAPKTSHRGALSPRGSSRGTLPRAGPLLPLVRPPPPAATAALGRLLRRLPPSSSSFLFPRGAELRASPSRSRSHPFPVRGSGGCGGSTSPLCAEAGM